MKEYTKPEFVIESLFSVSAVAAETAPILGAEVEVSANDWYDMLT